MRKALVILCLILVMVLSVACTPTDVDNIENMMGTVVRLRIEGKDAVVANDAIFDMIADVDKHVSTSIDTSTISCINNAKKDTTIQLDDYTNDMVKASFEYYERTAHLFDISIFPLVDVWQFSPNKVNTMSKEPPTADAISEAQKLVGLNRVFSYNSEAKTVTKNVEGAKLDLGAIAKGYIADKAKAILDGYDIDRAIIDIGRTLYLYGDKTYRVGISHPRPSIGNDLLKAIDCKNISVSTSGDYERYYKDINTGERYHHIIDPSTGRPAKTGIVSVTIVADSAMVADILSTSVFVMGMANGTAMLDGIDGVDSAVIVTETDGVLKTHEYTK